MEKVLIIGNGYAGLEAARVLARDGRTEVAIVSAEPCPAYCPHLLPEVAAGRRMPGDVFLADRKENSALAATFRPGYRVARLDPGRRLALLENGEEIAFDKALIASGSNAAVPRALTDAAARCGNVLGFRRIGDALALREHLSSNCPRLVIVGAGRVGVLLAEALRGTGTVVSLVEIGPEILPTMLLPEFAARLRPRLERPGLDLRLGVSIVRVSADRGRVREVRLSDGTILPCDALVIATGVDPNHDFLDDGLREQAGVVVDARLETRIPGVFAAGDVVQFETVTGRREPGQLAMNARAQGAVAARNILGEGISCPPLFTGNVVKVGSLIGARIGEMAGSDSHDFRIGKSAARFVLEGNDIVGLQFAGEPEDLKGLSPAVLKRFGPSDVADLLAGSACAGFGTLLLARGHAWA